MCYRQKKKKKKKIILPLVRDQSQCFHPSNQAMLFAIVGFHLHLLKPTKMNQIRTTKKLINYTAVNTNLSKKNPDK